MNGRARPGFRNENTQTRASKINIGFFERAKSFQTRTFSQTIHYWKGIQSIVQIPDTGWNKKYVTKKKHRFFCKKGGVPYLASLSLSSLSLFLFSLSKFPLFLRKQRLFYSSLYHQVPLYICFVLLLFHVTNLSISIVIETIPPQPNMKSRSLIPSKSLVLFLLELIV